MARKQARVVTSRRGGGGGDGGGGDGGGGNDVLNPSTNGSMRTYVSQSLPSETVYSVFTV